MTVGIIVQTRTGSTRLPGKVMMKADDKLLMIDYVIDQLKNSHTHFAANDLEYVQNRFLEFSKNQTLKHAILRSAELLQRGEYDNIKSLIDEAKRSYCFLLTVPALF